jgi:hypothetical protein
MAVFHCYFDLPISLVTFTSGSPSKYATAFLKRMQTVGLNLYNQNSFRILCFILVSILVLAKAIFIAFMAFLPHYSQMSLNRLTCAHSEVGIAVSNFRAVSNTLSV